jgi:hypothetical protein
MKQNVFHKHVQCKPPGKSYNKSFDYYDKKV